MSQNSGKQGELIHAGVYPQELCTLFITIKFSTSSTVITFDYC